MKKAYLIHGWEGNPENCWFPWLKKSLEEKGFEVIVPAMPDTEDPKIGLWVEKIKEIVINPDKDTYFITHSIGGPAVMRYLESLPEETKVGGIIFVAGFFNLPYLETEEEKVTAKPWLETPINTDKVKKIANKIVAIFSDDDPDVPLSDKDLFKDKLNAKIIIEHNKGHFSDDAGVMELPVILENLYKM